MPESSTVHVDVVIIGGGIQGLFLLNSVLGIDPTQGRKFSAVLLNRGPLAGEQTAHSHAYIHYGHMFRDPERIALARRGAQKWEEWFDDNSDTGSRVTSYFGFEDKQTARKVSQGWGDRPDWVTRGSDPVLSRLDGKWQCLAKVSSFCLHAPQVAARLLTGLEEFTSSVEAATVLGYDSQGVRVAAEHSDGERLTLHASALVLCAGRGNEQLIDSIGGWAGTEICQSPPAYMLLVSGEDDILPVLNGYFYPAAFVVTRSVEGKNRWLLSDRLRPSQKPFGGGYVDPGLSGWARQAVAHVFEILPELSSRPDRVEWCVYRADKAEGWHEAGRLPDRLSVEKHPTANIWAAFPNLFTLAPETTAEILKQITFPGTAWPGSCPGGWLRFLRPLAVSPEASETANLLTWQGFCSEHPVVRERFPSAGQQRA